MTISEDERIKKYDFAQKSVKIQKPDKEGFKYFLNDIIKQNIKLKATSPYIHDTRNESIFFHPETTEFVDELLPKKAINDKYGLDSKRVKKNNLFLEYSIIERMENKEKKEKFYSIL